MLTVSIAIHNPDLAVFEKMLNSLKKHTPELSKLIIIDNNSESKDFREIIERLFDPSLIRIIYNQENMGFGRAHNIALREADTPYFAVLNDDIEFFENWSTDMIQTLEKNPDIAQVGMGTDVCNKLKNDAKAYYEDTEDPDYIEGSCFVMPTELARSFGLFDESYEFAYFEDTDLSLRLKKAGYRISAIKKNWRHYRAKTSGKVEIDIKGYHAKNEFLFRKRWNAYLLSKKFGRTIIIKREGSIGDVFLITPIARAIKEREPDSVIILMTRTPQAITDCKDIDFTIAMHIPFPCDEFIDLDYAYERDFRKHIVDAYADTAGVKVKRKTGVLTLNGNNPFDSVIPEKFGRFVALELSDTWPGKQWSKENYQELSKRIREDGTKVVIFGLTNKTTTIAYDLTFLNVLNVQKTINLIRKAGMYIGHEGLCTHIAQSVNIPSVVLFGCTLPEYTVDTSLESLKVVQTEALCRGCRHRYMAGTTIVCPRNHECMQMISVDRVFEAYKEMKGEFWQ